ncbi:hypothetical protein GCM10010172_51060 [Paractinoplanes ferrugineus]|uniref:Uncharacterized protein n=1 Tax=Paractinoplanes ferrugineus TaxID=113564 RepID=A0A919J747_9ACTN|nr:hypothetical protein [Actinoplanes ferrugineus]GIE16076.1 hypothetical protein Afe05nite_79160 [Actinoplanes ferrugineus]
MGTRDVGPFDDGVTTLRLPGFGWWLQWRGDGFWRDLGDVQFQAEQDGSHRPAEDDWIRWSGLARPQARGGEWGGVATWWLVFGEAPAGTTPAVTLADGTRPAVLRLGRLWAGEWCAVAQAVTIHVGQERFDPPFSEPFYRRREAEADDTGWFRSG